MKRVERFEAKLQYFAFPDLGELLNKRRGGTLGLAGRRASLGRIFLTELLILSDTMMRVTTALVLLFSLLSAPIASAVCRDCCDPSVEHQIPLCHDKAHAHLGPHMHHMNHVHMVSQDSDASVMVQQCDHQIQSRRLSCHSAPCLSAKPVPASVASIPANQLQIISQFPTVTICSSLPTARAHPPSGVYGIGISSSPFASAPLRI